MLGLGECAGPGLAHKAWQHRACTMFWCLHVYIRWMASSVGQLRECWSMQLLCLRVCQSLRYADPLPCLSFLLWLCRMTSLDQRCTQTPACGQSS
jgi:hypothetical protein